MGKPEAITSKIIFNILFIRFTIISTKAGVIVKKYTTTVTNKIRIIARLNPVGMVFSIQSKNKCEKML